MRRAWQTLTLLLLLGAVWPLMATALKDPTQPPWYQGEVPKLYTAPELTAVVIGAGRALAEINNQWLHVGEWVDGWQVVAINQKQVTLLRAGQTLTLSLTPTVLR